MAMYSEQVMKVYNVREYKDASGKKRYYSSVGVISKDQDGEYEPQFTMGLQLKGKDAREVVQNLPEGSYIVGLVKMYDFQTGKGENKEYKKAYELLKAKEFVFSTDHKRARNNSYQEDEFSLPF